MQSIGRERLGSRCSGCGAMPCESCAVQFSVFRRRRACPECERAYCAGCLRRGAGMCTACRTLSSRPLLRHAIAHLKPRDLQCFLHKQNISTRGCVEKEELVSLCLAHVNSGAYRRRGARAGAAEGGAGGASTGAFSTLKGFTNNINEFLNSAFDMRGAQPAPPPPPRPQPRPDSTGGNCYNTAHIHPTTPGARPTYAPPTASDPSTSHIAPDIRRSETGDSVSTSGTSGGEGGARVDTADCFEVEDLDDAGWEFVTRPPADPLPNDSEVLLTVNEQPPPVAPRPPVPPARPAPPAAAPRHLAPAAPRHLAPAAAPASPQRAASELDLRPERGNDDNADTNSLKDEPFFEPVDAGTPRRVRLEDISSESELAQLSARQLKELLHGNRVEFRGCLERQDLLLRAATLYRDHTRYRQQLEDLPLEECCKICMAAPLECVLLECGHMAACTACAKQLAECPICRQYVVRAVRFFRS